MSDEIKDTYVLGVSITINRPANFESTRYYFLWNTLENEARLDNELTVDILSTQPTIIKQAPAVITPAVFEIAAGAVRVSGLLDQLRSGDHGRVPGREREQRERPARDGVVHTIAKEGHPGPGTGL